MVKVLTVDDSPMMRKVIMDLVSGKGCDVFEAGSPKEAMEIVRKEEPHIVLLDIIMEDDHMSGVEALKQVKKEFPGTTVIMVTSISDQEDVIKECVREGADEYLSKPFRDEEISNLIDYYLERITQTKVLVVDDSDVVRNMIGGIASKADCKVLEAENQDDAIRLVKEQEPDIVFLDIILVDQVSGVAVLKETKSLVPDSKVIMVTSISGQEAIVKECVEFGADEFLSKPFKEQDILDIIHRYQIEH